MWQNIWCLLAHTKYHWKHPYKYIEGYQLRCSKCKRSFVVYE